MPVSYCKTVSRLLICGLLPVFNIQAEKIRAVDVPSMDFLEYLGGVEDEIDGKLSSPVELDLEAALVANNSGSETNVESEAGKEEKIDE